MVGQVGRKRAGQLRVPPLRFSEPWVKHPNPVTPINPAVAVQQADRFGVLQAASEPGVASRRGAFDDRKERRQSAVTGDRYAWRNDRLVSPNPVLLGLGKAIFESVKCCVSGASEQAGAGCFGRRFSFTALGRSWTISI